jgi:uncharacterized protein
VPPSLGSPDGAEGAPPVLDGPAARDVLRSARRIAIVGASAHAWRASNSVMAYLLRQGYDCVPVNPEVEEVLGRTCFPSLEAAVAEGGDPFDIVDVFRRAEHAPGLARSAVALRCGTLWLQQGVVSWEAAAIAHAGGVRVVMDRCTAADHRTFAASFG